jgi:predicted GTPase
MGAGGREFHNFNVLFRSDPSYEILAFTAAQIPGLAGRIYPPALAGPLYPRGIPIEPEDRLAEQIRERGVQEVILAYSDLAHEEVMHKASLILAAGADFRLLSPEATMLRAAVPVLSVCAVRTGCGKSPTTRYLCRLLVSMGIRPVVLRHPMAYGDLEAQRLQRFAAPDDLEKAQCTIEEREEYEPLIRLGVVVYAGVDYEAILREAEREAPLILWDGGNNDLPFLRPDLEIVVADALRPGHEVRYHPGETNLRRANVVIVNKSDAASPEAVETVRANAARLNPKAAVLLAASVLRVEGEAALQGRRVLIIEDGPTLTHGGMPTGAGFEAARRAGAEAVDPRPYAVGSIRQVYDDYPHLGPVLPAVGYFPDQLSDLAETIRRTPCDAIIVATPVDLGRLIAFAKPTVRVTYELEEREGPPLRTLLEEFLRKGKRA